MVDKYSPNTSDDIPQTLMEIKYLKQCLIFNEIQIPDYNIFLHENKKGCALFLILEVVGLMRDENK